MLKKAGLLRCTFVTLVVVYSMLLLTATPSGGGKKSSSRLLFSSGKMLSGQAVSSNSIFKNPTVRNDHIRVRYMGGDCGHDPYSFVINFGSRRFSDPVFCLGNNSFAFANVHLLFKLRGPPLENKLS